MDRGRSWPHHSTFSHQSQLQSWGQHWINASLVIGWCWFMWWLWCRSAAFLQAGDMGWHKSHKAQQRETPHPASGEEQPLQQHGCLGSTHKERNYSYYIWVFHLWKTPPEWWHHSQMDGGGEGRGKRGGKKNSAFWKNYSQVIRLEKVKSWHSTRTAVTGRDWWSDWRISLIFPALTILWFFSRTAEEERIPQASSNWSIKKNIQNMATVGKIKCTFWHQCSPWESMKSSWRHKGKTSISLTASAKKQIKGAVSHQIFPKSSDRWDCCSNSHEKPCLKLTAPKYSCNASY